MNHYAWTDFHITEEDNVRFDMDESQLPLRMKAGHLTWLSKWLCAKWKISWG